MCFPGNAGYRPCHQEVLKVVQGVVHQPPELGDGTAFYAFSYYFDRAVDAGLIGEWCCVCVGVLYGAHARLRKP